MPRHMNPGGDLLARSVPEELVLDPEGLVACWISDAEDWLFAYQDLSALTPREAFEGIECLGRLTRCHDSLVTNHNGMEVLNDLNALLTGESAEQFAMQAVSFPDLNAWLAQAKQIWDEATETADTVEVLIADLDAADFLCWYTAMHAPEVYDGSSFQQFSAQLSICQSWAQNHGVMFAIAEPTIRAQALTIPEEMNFNDPTGYLALSALKFVWMLDEIEQVWTDSLTTPDLNFLEKVPPLGSRVRDYQVTESPAIAGAEDEATQSIEPFIWYSPDQTFQATLFKPNRRLASGHTVLELEIGTGQDFADAATTLVGKPIQLGSAAGHVAEEKQNGQSRTFAEIVLEEISNVDGHQIHLLVDSKPWIQ